MNTTEVLSLSILILVLTTAVLHMKKKREIEAVIKFM